MNNDSKFLGEEPVGRLLFRLAIPTVAAQLINMLYNIVDRIYIGHMPVDGKLALTGVGVCLPIIMIVSAFAALVGVGGGPRASIFMGQGDNDSAERTVGACFSLQILLSVILTSVLLIFGRPLLMTFGASENTIDYAISYMNIYALGTVFVQITMGMNGFITAQGFAKTGMLTVLIGALLNITLDPLFIFVFDMGVRGAALATIISQCVSSIWVVSFLCGKKSFLHLKKENLPLSRKIIMPVIALGLAPFIMQASESVINICFNASLQRYGGDIAVGAMTILSSVTMFAGLPSQGLAQGAQPILSYNFGALKKDRVKKAFYLMLTCSVCYSLTLWLFVMIFPQFFAQIFTSDPELIPYAARALPVYYFGMALFGIQMACQMTFISLGNAKASITVAVMRKFVLLIPLIYILPQFMANKTMAVYMAEPIADMLSILFTSILFFHQFRKALKDMDKPVAA